MACLPSSNGLCFLIRPHQARIARHIGGEDRGKTAGRGHGCGSSLCSRLSLSASYPTTLAPHIRASTSNCAKRIEHLDPSGWRGRRLRVSTARDLRYRQPYDCHNRIVFSRHRVPLSGRENYRMELEMPDLDLIKQAEQGGADRRAWFAEVRAGNPDGGQRTRRDQVNRAAFLRLASSGVAATRCRGRDRGLGRCA